MKNRNVRERYSARVASAWNGRDLSTGLPNSTERTVSVVFDRIARKSKRFLQRTELWLTANYNISDYCLTNDRITLSAGAFVRGRLDIGGEERRIVRKSVSVFSPSHASVRIISRKENNNNYYYYYYHRRARYITGPTSSRYSIRRPSESKVPLASCAVPLLTTQHVRRTKSIRKRPARKHNNNITTAVTRDLVSDARIIFARTRLLHDV